ncbi:MAG: hypothetical protein IT375_14960 [Polyangiaceae bacterium]|nr:hypothetical protein [Polyangiaceae bacterium]MCK6533517.1 hypothetical protein [Polyangiaceae bacterium]
MLVLIGPPFSGSEDEYGRLAELTGILPYELKTKLRASAWGVVRALADAGQAEALAGRIRARGFRVAVVDPAVAADPSRMFVPLRGLELTESALVLHLSERAMPIPYRAVLTLVRGEVQVGSRQRSSRASSSSTFRAVVPEANVELAPAAQLDGFAAADLHFATVLWSARIDARSFDFSILGEHSGGAQDLDRLVDALAERIGFRVDRASRVSSVASFTGATGPSRQTSPIPGMLPAGKKEVPERFDAYSRLIAEAERQAQRHERQSTRPPPPG